MASYKELLAQREMLEAKIKEARETEIANALAQVKSLVSEFGLTAADIFSAPKRKSTSGTKVAPKYRHPDTQETWTGRGRPPRWLQGKDPNKYLISGKA